MNQLSDRLFDEERMYAYIEAYAAENHMEQTMRALPYALEKMREYIEETEQWFYPMIQSAKTAFLERANALFLLKYHISSVVETIKRML